MTYSTFVRHYRAPIQLEDGLSGTWYAEFDGTFSTREFIVGVDRILAAPFDFRFRAAGHPTEPPPLPDVAAIPLIEWESLWDRLAQPRLDVLASSRDESDEQDSIHYFLAPFPQELKHDEEGSVLYYEYADDAARRHFEVWPNAVAVAPYDTGTPEADLAEVLLMVRDGIDASGQVVDPRFRGRELSHREFEAEWRRHAIPRLRVIAGLA